MMGRVVKVVHSVFKLEGHTSKRTRVTHMRLDSWKKKEYKVGWVRKGVELGARIRRDGCDFKKRVYMHT